MDILLGATKLDVLEVRQVCQQRQLHLKIRCRVAGQSQDLILSVLVDTGAQVSLIKRGIISPELLQRASQPVRLKAANGGYMDGGTEEVMLEMDMVRHDRLSRPDLGQEVQLQGKFYVADMPWDIILGYDWLLQHECGPMPHTPGLVAPFVTSFKIFRIVCELNSRTVQVTCTAASQLAHYASEYAFDICILCNFPTNCKEYSHSDRKFCTLWEVTISACSLILVPHNILPLMKVVSRQLCFSYL